MPSAPGAWRPKSPQQQLGRALQDPDQRAHDDEEGADGRRHGQRGALGVAKRDRLRHELADHDVEEGQDEVRQDHGEHRREHRVEDLRERVLAERADRQRGERHAELHRGDEPRRRVGDPEHLTRAPVARAGELGQAGSPHGDEAVLRGDEEPVQKDQHRDGEELEEECHAPLSGAWVLSGSSKSAITAQYR